MRCGIAIFLSSSAVYGSGAVIYGGSAAVYGSSAAIYGSSAAIYGVNADIFGGSGRAGAAQRVRDRLDAAPAVARDAQTEHEHWPTSTLHALMSPEPVGKESERARGAGGGGLKQAGRGGERAISRQAAAVPGGRRVSAWVRGWDKVWRSQG
eukprot:2985443-Rhodomonas_salina.2